MERLYRIAAVLVGASAAAFALTIAAHFLGRHVPDLDDLNARWPR